MFKKIDKLITQSFFGLFFLTFSVVLFILLMVFMSKYFEDLVGKDLGFDVLGELFFYFSMTLVPQALPLAILLSSLMAFGNMGEHNELTAIKGCSISLIRILLPVGVFALFMTGVAYIFNDNIVPKVNLKAFRLMYDVKQKEPTLEFPEGSFYNGLPGWSLRIGEKVPQTDSIKDLIIYDHRSARGNTDVIIAEKGVMRNVEGKQMLELQVENGYRYSEQPKTMGKKKDAFVRDKFDEAIFSFDLSFLQLGETSEELFQSNRFMMTIDQLSNEADSLYIQADEIREQNPLRARSYFDYAFFVEFEKERLAEREKASKIVVKKDSIDISSDTSSFPSSIATSETDTLNSSNIDSTPSLVIKKDPQNERKRLEDSILRANRERTARLAGARSKFINNNNFRNTPPNAIEALDTVDWASLSDTLTIARQNFNDKTKAVIFDRALTKIRNMRSFTRTNDERTDKLEYNARRALIEKNKRYSLAVACFVMFLIGAPLGAIIKKGGLGVPVLLSIVFFILFYILTITGDKWAREKVVSIFIGSWAANLLLTAFGILFLLQARADSRLFEIDNYLVIYDRIKAFFVRKKKEEIIKS